MRIRSALNSEAPKIAQIYIRYVQESIISFEEMPLTSNEIKLRIHSLRNAGLSFLAKFRAIARSLS
jgi:L-amino acid N-acyltransferase YncA